MRLTRQITVGLTLGVAVAFATVGLLALWVVRHTDNMAATAVQTMLAGGGRSSAQQYAVRTNDYAWWGEAYRAYLRADDIWFDVNVGTGVTETAIADVLAIYSPEGAFRYGWSAEGLDDPATIITRQVFDSAVRVLEGTPLSAQGAQTFIAPHGDTLLLVGAARMSPGDSSGPDKSALPMVMLASYLTADRVAAFGADYLVSDLRLANQPEPGRDSRPILNERGEPLAYLTWAPPTPGRDALLGIAMPLTLAMLLFLGTMLVILSRAQRLAEALVVAARQDYLTDSLNRKGLGDFLLEPQGAAALVRGDIAVICADINGFKAVNDTVGHAAGDKVICDLADRIKAEMPPSAKLARVGGNAFVVVLTGAEAGLAASLAGRLPAILGPPFTVDGIEFHLSAAVGYARGEPGMDSAAVIDRADTAMYHAKRLGTREPLPYASPMESHALERKQFETRLRSALAKGEIRVVYQPILRLHDMTVAGLEALVRWRSPEIGDVAAEQLIAVAEESGLIREVGAFVLNRVCEDMRRWPGTRVSVNISPSQLRDTTFVDGVRAILIRHSIDPARIELELTETVLLDNPDAAAAKLTELRKLGVSMALDDFGVGFASIGALRRFPIDRLKIDRTFVAGIEPPKGDAGLVKSFVGLANSMGVAVVCEGIETPAQARILTALGCEFGQGYFFSKPLEADDMEAQLNRGSGFPVREVKKSAAFDVPADAA